MKNSLQKLERKRALKRNHEHEREDAILDFLNVLQQANSR